MGGGFEIGLQYRIIYRVDFAAKVIELMAAGTHKIYLSTGTIVRPVRE